jgi:phage terminase small subunit
MHKRPTTVEGLTDLQRRFIVEFCKDGNATAAVRRAGYRAASGNCYTIARRLLSHLVIAQAVRTELARRFDRLGVSADQVVRELTVIAFLDPAELLDEDEQGNEALRALADLPPWARRALKSVKFKRVAREPNAEVVEYQFADKVAALQTLARMFGLLRDGSLKPAPGVNTDAGPRADDLDDLTDEQLEELNALYLRFRAERKAPPG